MFQQNPEKYHVSIVILNSLTSKLDELMLFVPSFLKQLYQFEKNSVYVIEKP
jgi:hypothetical protein